MARIVCGVDHSTPARAAARLSAALARRLRLGLVLAHALPRSGDRSAALAMLEELRGELDVPTACLRVEIGPAPERLARAGTGAALVVVGGADGRADRARLGGSVRASLIRRAPCPVAVVPAVPRLGGSEVICGVRDWADVATASIATGLAGALDLALTLVHVLPTAVGPREASASPGVLDRPWDHESAQRLLEVVASAVGGTPSLRVEHGIAGRRLAHEATAADAGLLVVGPPTRGRLEAALSGSASSHLIHRCRRPLVVCCGAPAPVLPRAVS